MLNKLEDSDAKVAAFLEKFSDYDRHFAISAVNGEGCKELIYGIMVHLLQIAALHASHLLVLNVVPIINENDLNPFALSLSKGSPRTEE